jgi:hypothetical protein
MIRGFLAFCCVSRSEVFAKNVSTFAENVLVYFFGGHGNSRDSPVTTHKRVYPKVPLPKSAYTQNFKSAYTQKHYIKKF